MSENATLLMYQFYISRAHNNSIYSCEDIRQDNALVHLTAYFSRKNMKAYQKTALMCTALPEAIETNLNLSESESRYFK